MQLPTLADDLSTFASFVDKGALYSDFIAQLNRDISRAGVALHVADFPVLSLNEVVKEIELALRLSIQKSHLSIQQLLYVIDIDENQSKQLSMTAEDPVQAIALLIVKRILQKVITRKLYS